MIYKSQSAVSGVAAVEQVEAAVVVVEVVVVVAAAVVVVVVVVAGRGSEWSTQTQLLRMSPRPRRSVHSLARRDSLGRRPALFGSCLTRPRREPLQVHDLRHSRPLPGQVAGGRLASSWPSGKPRQEPLNRHRSSSIC